LVIPAGTKDPCPADDCWAGTFSAGWYYQPGLNGPLVPAAKNAEANAKLGHRSKVCSLVVFIRPQLLFYPVITRTSSEFVVFANMQEKGAAVIIIC